MIQLLLGFCIGVYVGTYYDCKSTLDCIETNIKKFIPKKKDKK